MLAIRHDLDPVTAPLIRVHEPPIDTRDNEQAYAPALSFPRYATARQVIDALRTLRPDDASVYYLFVTDEDRRLVGVVDLHRLVVAHPEARLAELMRREVIALPECASFGEQARAVARSGLLAMPLLDRDGRLLGAMDASDLIARIEQETTGEMFHLAGVSPREAPGVPLHHVAGARLRWLLLGLLSALLVASVLAAYITVMAAVWALAMVLPVVVWLGSRAAMQTLTVVVRSLSRGEVRQRHFARLLGREVLIGLVNGLATGSLAGMLGYLWQGSVALGVIAGLSTLGTIIVASLAGVGVPLGLKVLRLDPAVASSTIVVAAANLSACGLVLGLGALAVQYGYL